jgi:hypothetical protein
MSERILAGYISQDELAAQLNKRRRTLQEWDRRHVGPPITRVGGTPYYQVDAVREWLQTCSASQREALTVT